MNYIRININTSRWEIVDLTQSFTEKIQILTQDNVKELFKQKPSSQKLFSFMVSEQMQDHQHSLIIKDILNQFSYSIDQIQLYLQNNVEFTRNDFDNISMGLINHTKITCLDLDLDICSCETLDFLPYLIEKNHPIIKSLTELCMNFITTAERIQNFELIMQSIPQIPQLIQLVLKFDQCFFMNQEPTELYDTISNCQKLNHLYLAFSKSNFIGNKEEIEIAKSILNINKLISYKLELDSYNDMEGFQTAQILKNSSINTFSICLFDLDDPITKRTLKNYILRKIKKLVQIKI